MSRVLITGATGFIGRHCLPSLLARGYEVHAVTAHTPRIDLPGVVWHQADLLDATQTIALVAQVQPSHLLHLAWYVTPGKFWTAPENLAWVAASLALVQTFVAHGGKRAVISGTCAEYDWRYGYCVEAVTPLAPTTLYGAAKHALQMLSTAYAAQQSLSMAWGRIFFLYGPYEPPVRFVASVVRSLLRDEAARCSHGRQVRDLLYVQDVADAFVALLASDVQGPVNIGSGSPVTLGEVACLLGQAIGRLDLIKLGAIDAPADDPPLLVAAITRLHSEVGWRPTYTLQDGLAQTINWWRQHPEMQNN